MRVRVVALLTLLLALALGAVACSSTGGDSDDDGGEPEVGDDIRLARLEVGDCFDARRSGLVDEVELANCRDDHDWEAVALVEFDEDDDYPDEDDFEDEAADECDEDFDAFFAPDEDSWDDGDRILVCAISGEEEDDETPTEDEDTPTEEEDTPTPTEGEPTATPTRSSSNQPGDFVAFTDLEIGDCFFITDLGDAEIVSCDGAFQFLVIDLFDVTGGDAFPGAEALAGIANQECPADSTNFIAPSEGTWQRGDRQISCMTAGDGGGGDDGSMSQIVSVFDLLPGDCYVETGDPNSVELVSCGGPFDAEVLDVLIVADGDGSYPGEAFFDDIAINQCPVGTTGYLFPSDSTWADGDREVVCLAQP